MTKLNDVQKIEIIQKYIGGISVYELAKIYELNQNSVKSILTRRGIVLRKKGKYRFDDSFFNEINNEKKSYWLGFIYADGNVFKSTMSIKLSSKDLGHIYKFKHDIKSEHPIEPILNKDAFRIRLNSVNFVNSLLNCGVTPNKSSSILFPDFINDDLKIHFIRGVFDGDGWLTFTQTKDMIQPSWSLGFCSGSYLFLDAIQKVIDLNGSLYERKGGYQLLYSGNNNVEKVLELIYKNSSTYLERKHVKYLDFYDQRNMWNDFMNIKNNRYRNEKGQFISSTN